MFSQWVFLSVLALAVPSFAWAEDAVSDLAKEQSKAEQGDKRGDELFAEFTRLRQAAETGSRRLCSISAPTSTSNRTTPARANGGARRPLRGWSARRSNWPCSIAMVTAGHRTRPRRHAGSGRPRSRGCRRPE